MAGHSPSPSRSIFRKEAKATGETMRSAGSEDGATEMSSTNFLVPSYRRRRAGSEDGANAGRVFPSRKEKLLATFTTDCGRTINF